MEMISGWGIICKTLRRSAGSRSRNVLPGFHGSAPSAIAYPSGVIGGCSVSLLHGQAYDVRRQKIPGELRRATCFLAGFSFH
jgi:hypothetical protein